MRFRVRDILLAAALVAVCLGAVKYALNNAENGAFAGLRINTLTVSFLSMPFISVFFGVCQRRLAIRKAKPIVCEFRAFPSWRSHFVMLASLWAFAIVFSPINNSWGAMWFVVVSVTVIFFIVVSVLPTLFNSVEVGPPGIVYQARFTPWSKIQFVRSADDTIVQLRYGKLWAGVTVDVPSQHREQISQLLQNAKAEDK